jgi:ABC-type transport system substrate-binding protein
MIQVEGFSPENEFPTLTIYFKPPRNALKNRIFQAIKAQLDAVGINSRLDFYDSPEDLFRVGGPYLVFHRRTLSIPDPEDMISPLFHSQSLDNIFGYQNSRVDSLIKEVEVERSMKKRIQLFHRIEKILLRDIPAVPLFSHQNRVAMQPYVRGVVVPALGFYYIDATKIWLDR